jgi:GxxExxY protein
MTNLLYKEEVYKIVGAAMDIYNELGFGFLESVYQEVMEIELEDRGIPFRSQTPIRILYKGQALSKEYIADILCYHNIIVELKAIEQLTERESAQLLNYLKATGFKVGLLINFGSKNSLEWKRFVN